MCCLVLTACVVVCYVVCMGFRLNVEFDEGLEWSIRSVALGREWSLPQVVRWCVRQQLESLARADHPSGKGGSSGGAMAAAKARQLAAVAGFDPDEGESF